VTLRTRDARRENWLFLNSKPTLALQKNPETMNPFIPTHCLRIITSQCSRITPSALAIVLAMVGHAHCSDLVGGWNFLDPGVTTKKASFGELGVPLAFSGRIAGFVVDATTTPSNPFPGTERAYYLTPEDQNGAVRMFFRPFVDTNPENGYFEFSFRLVEGRFDLAIGETSLPYDPKYPATYAKGDRFFAVSFISDKPMAVGKIRNLFTPAVPLLMAEENYTFRISWQPDGDNLIFSPMLNGEPLTGPDASPVTIPIAKSALGTGVLSFILNSGSADAPCAKVFFGGIQVDPFEGHN